MAHSDIDGTIGRVVRAYESLIVSLSDMRTEQTLLRRYVDWLEEHIMDNEFPDSAEKARKYIEEKHRAFLYEDREW